MSENRWPQPIELTLRGLRVFFPPLRDPRYLVWSFQLIFFVIGVELGSFSKSYDVLLTSVLVAGTVDFFLMRRKTGKLIFPQSGFISGTSVALLLQSTYLWIYAVAAAVAILSKYAFTSNGKHIYNPGAYGALFVVALFPRLVVSDVTQWGGMLWFTLFIWLAGSVTASAVRVKSAVLFWMMGFFTFAFVRSFLYHAKFLTLVGVMTGGSFALFSFFMITDPRTMPVSIRERFVFCFLVAAIDAVFRVNQNPYAIFYGLIIGATIYQLGLAVWGPKRAPA